MSPNEMREPRRRGYRRSVVAGVLGVALVGTGLVAATAEAAKTSFPMSFNPETAAGFTNTYSTESELNPACPQALAGTPGSDPASKILNDALNTPESFLPGGTVHYTYKDNPHLNGGTANFTIQDCVVVYDSSVFDSGDFNDDGVLIDASKNQLSGGTQIDGASLSGISSSVGSIYFSWTSPADGTAMTPGNWVCNFARDIKNSHGGGGNRKVPPTCYQVGDGGGGGPLFEEPLIFAGYADTFHTGIGGTLFTPWSDLSGVTYWGCEPGNCGGDDKFDAGAIRIDNQDPQPLTLNEAWVTIGACTFRPWQAFYGTTAPAGGSFILTQTGQLGAPIPQPCAAHIAPQYLTQTNFDTSEPPGAIQCNPALGEIPVIHLRFANGVNLDIQDSAKILNTDGVDRATCFGVSEATSWTEILY